MKPRDPNDILREEGKDGLRVKFDASRRPRQLPVRTNKLAPDINTNAEGRKPKRGNGDDIAVEAGAALLDDVRDFVCRFVCYPTKHAATAHVLWIAHAHLMGAWESTPRLAFLSPEPASGKTRALEVTQLLVPNPIATMNATPAYLFRRCGNQKDGTPTILFDEVDALFGPRAKENEDIRAFINSGHRRGAAFGRCVVHGKTISTEEIESYAAVVLAGLGWLPDTIMSRSVVIRMRRRAPDEHVDEFRHRVHAPVGKELCRRLAAWASAVVDAAEQSRPDMPIGVEDRSADMWEPLLAAADLAGGNWPKSAREAAVAFVAAGRETPNSLNLLLLSDLRAVFEDNKEAVRRAVPEGLSTKAILAGLVALEDAPWGDLKGKPLDANRLAVRLRHYDVKSQNLRPDGTDRSQCKGYHLADLADVWPRYLPPSQITPSQASQEGENPRRKPMSATAGTSGTPLVDDERVMGVVHAPLGQDTGR